MGDFGGTSELADVILASYDRDGNLVDTSLRTPSDITFVNGGAGYATQLSNTSASGSISYFQVRANGPGADHVAIDTIVFMPPAGPPSITRAFDIARVGPNPFALGLKPGEARTAPIRVYRYGASAGAIVFDFPSLPPFLQAEVTPNPADVPDGGSVTLKLTATEGASPVVNTPVTVRARAINPAATGPSEPKLTVPVTVLGRQTLAIGGIEVTQGVQEDLNNPPGALTPVAGTDAGLPKPGSIGAAATYAGVKLVDHRKTIVRVFADSGSAGTAISGANVTLEGIGSSGKPLPDSPLLPEYSPPTVNAGPLYTAMAQRVSPTGAFTFTLPPSWTTGTIALKASINVPGFLAGPETSAVSGSFKLQGIRFTPTGTWDISPFEGKTGSGAAFGPYDVFAGVRATMPFAEGNLLLPGPTKAYLVCPPPVGGSAVPCFYRGDPSTIRYQGNVDLTDIVNCTYNKSFFGGTSCDDRKDATTHAMDKFLADQVSESYGLGDTSVLVVDGPSNQFGGVTRPDEDTADREEYNPSVVTPQQLDGAGSVVQRALSDVAHEVGHGMGLAHAGQACPLTGPGADQEGVPWPADDMGLIQGIGIDPRGTASGPAPYKLFAQGLPKPAQRWFDLMSYCAGANDKSNWISSRYWNQLVDFLAARTPHGASASAVRATGPAMLSVWANVNSSGKVEIDPVRRAIGRVAVPEGGTSRFHLVALDSAGRTLSDSPMQDEVSHIDGLGALVAMKALVPAAGVATLHVTRDGAVLATRSRSPHAPRVRILEPRARQRTGRRRTTTVRWQASDADRDPMFVEVDYSTNGGRRWRNVYVGPNRARLALPSSFFAGSRSARIRITANDGFNETSAVSARFVAHGTAPGVLITSPAYGRRFTNDTAIYLSGEGYDDARRALRGRALRWFAGRRAIGFGNQITTLGLPAGRQRIRLVARDRRDRSSSVAIVLRLVQATPRLLALRTPKRQSTRARSLRIRVATTVPATLRIGRVRFHVDRRLRTLTLRVSPGRGRLKLTLRLAAGRKRSSGTITITRR